VAAAAAAAAPAKKPTVAGSAAPAPAAAAAANANAPTTPAAAASFNVEILSRLDALLCAKQPLDKNADVYLEGKDVIKVLHSLASGAEPTQFAFNRNTLVAQANPVITKLSACLNLSFVCAEAQGEGDVDPTGGGAGGIDVQLLSVCLAALMALFRLPELCREVSPAPLRDMLACTCSRLLDERLAATAGPYAATAAQVIKALNKISIQSAVQVPRSASLSALLYLLSHPVSPSPQSSAKFSSKIVTIFAKLFNRILTEEIENATGHPFAQVDMTTVIFALNDFFSEVPRKEKGNDTQYDAALGLLKRLVLHIGNDALVTSINATLPNGLGKPLLGTLQKEIPADMRRAEGSSDERLAQLKQKLRNSQDDTF
jgi:hypothetical protein